MKTIIASTVLTLLSTAAFAGNDYATQTDVNRLDAEDMRIHGGEVKVKGSKTVIEVTVGDHGKSRGRAEVYTKTLDIDVTSLKGQDGQDGADGAQGIQGEKGDRGRRGAKGDTGAAGAAGAKGDTGAKGAKGDTGAAGAKGDTGAAGAKGDTGAAGAKGDTGAAGRDGVDGANGKDAVAPLGSLSFAAATASFSGDGIGFGLSDSNYGGLEGSIVLGFDLDYNWRVVAGVTTDFKDKVAASVGLGYSF